MRDRLEHDRQLKEIKIVNYSIGPIKNIIFVELTGNWGDNLGNWSNNLLFMV